MRSLLAIDWVLCILAVFAVASAAHGGDMTVSGVAGGDFRVKITSMKEARFRTTIRQQYDFSCGSAALATLLTYHYDNPVTEQKVFDAMFEAGDQEKIRKQGFSMLDMKNYLEANGFKAEGFQLTLDKLAGVGVPAIVLINHNGYKHFVVLKGVTEGEVLLGDPSMGTRKLPRADFESMWKGLAFMVLSKKEVAKNHFNSGKEWHVREKAPLGMALRPSDLANVTMFLPGRSDF